jgi:hypothetical protein
MEEMKAEAERIKTLSNEQCLMTKMTIYVPNYIVVRTSSTAGDTVDDPTIF